VVTARGRVSCARRMAVIVCRKRVSKRFVTDSGSALRRKANTLPAELLKVSAEAPEAASLRYACDFIQRGQVIGVPTDTYYGLAADPFNLSAVEQIYRVKGRPETRALPILVASVDQAESLARDLPDTFSVLARKFWPGALTLLVDASHRLPLKVTAGTGRVALRWARSKVVCSLIEALEGPITGTSANISGFPACSSAEQLTKQLGERLPLIVDSGETGAMLASTIVDLQGDHWRILREGIVTEGDIRQALES
jgi:L-threonylcarbamoyladenylate synthase